MPELERLLTLIRRFRDERDWLQFHNPKDMAAAIAIEATELQELFLWKNGAEIDAVLAAKRGHIEDECADIAVYLLELCDNLKIDLPAAIEHKLAKNALKYPVDKARGSNAKYTDL
ncbi:MAG: nucleotide pyrophosphohydrolase [bacterium]|nr:nucleotide pyrophosphohydrolase [bacterium]